MRIRGIGIETLILIAAGVAIFFVVLLLSNAFQTFEWAQVAVYFIAIVGLNILTGYSGQISLGNGAFMALGGYTTALLYARFHFPEYASIPVAGILAGVGGFLFGIPALRLRGLYLALATFALALAVTPLANHYDDFTGGHVGLHLAFIAPPPGVDMVFSSSQWLFLFDSAIALIMFIPAALLVSSKTGRAWTATRDSEAAAVASGVNIPYYKTLAFAISAFYAGVAGSLQVIGLSYVNPDNYGLSLSLALLVGLVIGGLASRWGPLFGAVLVIWLPNFAEGVARIHIGSLTLEKPDVFYGALLLVIVFFAPGGVASLINRALAWYRSRRRAVTGEIEVAPAVLEEPLG